MGKIKKILKTAASFMQKDVYYFICLGIIVLTYGLNLWLNLFLYILFSLNLLANIKKDKFFHTFFALVFFEPQVHSALIFSPIMLSSLVKVYYIFFLFRIVIDLKNKTKFKFDIISTVLGVLFIITTFAYAENFTSGASYMSKTVAIILYMTYYFKASDNREKIIGDLLSVVALFTLFAGVYSLTRGIYWDNRLCSTIPDPNYSALFFAMGLFSSFGATMFKKWLRIIITIALAGLLLMTMSLTGIFVALFVLFIYLLITKGFKKVLIAVLIIAAIGSAILFMPTKEGTTFNNLQNRVNKFYVIDETDYTLQGHDDYCETELYLNYVTNNRYYLTESYLNEFSLLSTREKLIGGNNVMTGPVRDKLEKEYGYVSHNSYIDLLFMIGLIPALILVACLILKLFWLFDEYKRTRSKQILCFAFLKIVMMAFGLTISFFPYRYFIVFMLI
jgi:hypothetical protein